MCRLSWRSRRRWGSTVFLRMKCKGVFTKVSLCFEPQAAIWACEWTNLVVNHLIVSLKSILECKCWITFIALVWLDFFMDTPNLNQGNIALVLLLILKAGTDRHICGVTLREGKLEATEEWGAHTYIKPFWESNIHLHVCSGSAQWSNLIDSTGRCSLLVPHVIVFDVQSTTLGKQIDDHSYRYDRLFHLFLEALTSFQVLHRHLIDPWHWPGCTLMLTFDAWLG